MFEGERYNEINISFKKVEEKIVVQNIVTLSSNLRNCATCTYWCGKQIPDAFCNFIQVDLNERAKCVGGECRGAQMMPMFTCRSWTPRFKK